MLSGRAPGDAAAFVPGLVGAQHASPSGPAFTVVLVLHVAAALVGLVTLVASAVAALRLLGAARGREATPSALAYFAGGTNWAGRTLYLVPVFGFALIGLSGGRDSVGDGWVLAGLGLWAVAAAIAEAALWPAERRVHAALQSPPGVPDAGTAGEGDAAGLPAAQGPATDAAAEAVPAEAVRACRVVVGSSSAAVALVVAAMVVMVARP